MLTDKAAPDVSRPTGGARIPVRWTIAAGLSGLATAAFALTGVPFLVGIAARLLGVGEPGGALAVPLVFGAAISVSLAISGLLAPPTWRARALSVGIAILTFLALFIWLGLTFSDASPLAHL